VAVHGDPPAGDRDLQPDAGAERRRTARVTRLESLA
jgi:hypothetical protein